MKLTVHMVELAEPSKIINAMDFNTADHHTLLVAPYTDPEFPCILVPFGYSIVSFRFFSNENSLTVYLGKGKIYE